MVVMPLEYVRNSISSTSVWRLSINLRQKEKERVLNVYKGKPEWKVEMYNKVKMYWAFGFKVLIYNLSIISNPNDAIVIHKQTENSKYINGPAISQTCQGKRVCAHRPVLVLDLNHEVESV